MIRDVEVDCLVIGAGPAGSVAAKAVAERGHSVLMIEKRGEIGVPVRCGEGISKLVLQILDMEDERSFVSSKMEGAIIHSPSGPSLDLGIDIAGPEAGFIIRREEFDQFLARRAARAGAEIWVRAEAMSFQRKDGTAHIKVEHLKERANVRARVVIGADGFESQVAAWGGLDTRLSLKDVDSCIQYEMVGIEPADRSIEFFIGNAKAPGGYIWCFPKGKDIANVGIGINGSRTTVPGEPKKLLDRFIMNNERFKKGAITEINAGGVSVCLPSERTVSDNMLLVGDAARMIDPLTGGGVYNACFSALKAGEVVDRALGSGDVSEKGLSEYESLWREGLEAGIARNYLAKERFMELSDQTLDKVIEAVSGYDMKEISTGELIKAVGARYPEVLKELGL